MTLWDGDNHNVAESVFEVKAGVRAATAGVCNVASFELLAQNPKVKAAIANNRKHLKNGVSATKTALVFSAPSFNKLKAAMAAATSAELFSMVTLPRATWTSVVSGFELISTDDASVEVCWGHLGMMENRLLLSGDMTVHGYRASQIPGDTYADKRNYLIQTTKQELAEKLDSSGFRVVFHDGMDAMGNCIVSIPTGYIIMTAMTNCNYLRWVFAGDDRDSERVKQSLQMICDIFPDVKASAGYSEFATFLGCRI